VEKSKRLVRLNIQHVTAIAKKLKISEYISGFENKLSEQDKARFDYEELSAIILQVVFGDCTPDKLPDNVDDWVNLYLVFLTGIGTSSLVFNECGFDEYVRHSISLKDLNRIDFDYQEHALTALSPDYSPKEYKYFNCDYWIRFIDENKCLRYATIRTVNAELYWKLNKAKMEYTDQLVPFNAIFPELFENKIKPSIRGNGTDRLKKLHRQLIRFGIDQLNTIYNQPVAFHLNCPATVFIQRSFDHSGYPYLTFILTESAGEKVDLRAFNESFEMLADSRLNSDNDRSYITFASDYECKMLENFMIKEEQNFIEKLSKYYHEITS
jgi:hypothetical protein